LQPLVCVGGQPSAAVWRLLELLAAGGARFDYDWGGARIARTVLQRVDWQPWRYDHQAYEAAASAAHPLTPLAGEPVDTPWDPELARGEGPSDRPRQRLVLGTSWLPEDGPGAPRSTLPMKIATFRFPEPERPAGR
jgi:hypothetical protein